MTALLDTDVLVDVLRGVEQARLWLQEQADQPLIVPGIVAMELFAGCANKEHLRRCRAFLDQFSLAWTEAKEFELACDFLAEFRLGSGIGIPDCLIAAMAHVRNATVYTFNLRHFRLIPNLNVQSPYARPVK